LHTFSFNEFSSVGNIIVSLVYRSSDAGGRRTGFTEPPETREDMALFVSVYST